MLQWLLKHDIIFLSETKTNCDFHVPGFNVIIGKTKSPNCGGVALLVRNALSDKISFVDVSYSEQIWAKFSFLPQVIFGGCYVPPSDSIYYSDENFNAKFGCAVNELVNNEPMLQYLPCDPNRRGNSNGSRLLNICRDSGILLVNNIQYGNVHIRGALMYREKHQWVSELDICLISKDAIKAVSNLHVDQNLSMPSDHAPVTVSLDRGHLESTSSSDLLTRAGQLGNHTVLHKAHAPTAVNKQISRRPVRYTDIDCDLFQHTLGEIHPPDIDVNNYEVAAELFTDTIYDCASNCKTSNVHTAPNNAVISDDRWENILNSNDDKPIWNSINWKGNIEEPEYEMPPDSNFQEHLETILNPEDGMQLNQDEYLSDVHIPVLNDPMYPIEMEDVIHKQLKPNTGCGPDGIAPGLFRSLPIQWLLNLTILLNCVFFNAYPVKWTYANLHMLFKKGDKANCDNYRGISMINSVAKIYDYILCNRLTQWFTPDREQAGAQKKWGCIEHLVTLRLIINYCFRKNLQLYIAYIDFSKAYDRVPRNKL